MNDDAEVALTCRGGHSLTSGAKWPTSSVSSARRSASCVTPDFAIGSVSQTGILLDRGNVMAALPKLRWQIVGE